MNLYLVTVLLVLVCTGYAEEEIQSSRTVDVTTDVPTEVDGRENIKLDVGQIVFMKDDEINASQDNAINQKVIEELDNLKVMETIEETIVEKTNESDAVEAENEVEEALDELIGNTMLRGSAEEEMDTEISDVITEAVPTIATKMEEIVTTEVDADSEEITTNGKVDSIVKEIKGDAKVEAAVEPEPLFTNEDSEEIERSLTAEDPTSAPTNLIQNIDLVDEASTDLITAAQSGSISAVEKVLNELGTSTATGANKGYVAGVASLYYGTSAMTEVLLNKGEISLNGQGITGNTLLMFASIFGKYDHSNLLLTAGADYTLRNNKGDSALSLAQKGGYREIVKLLRSFGATQ